jgi:hypothetical protein
MTQLAKSLESRPPLVSPVVVMVCAAAVLWAMAVQQEGNASRYPAVPLSLATFLAVQLLIPRARWNHDRVLGPGNVAALLFALQLVVIPTLIVLSAPYPGSLGFIPADQYVNTALMAQALAYACYAIGYVAWATPMRPKPLLAEGGLATGIAFCFIAFGVLGLALEFSSVGELAAYFSGHGDIFDAGPASLAGAAAQFLRPFLAYGVIILWAARISGRRPGTRLQPVELALIVVAIAASATYNYNRGAVIVPVLALVTAYGCTVRRPSPAGIAAFLAIVAVLGFMFGQYRNFYSATHGGAINPAAAGLDRPAGSFTDDVQAYGNGPQFWAIVIQEVDRTGKRTDESITDSAMSPIPVVGKPFRDESGSTVYNELIYGQPEVHDQILGFGAELYWNYGIPGIVVGYVLLGFAVRRFDDRVGAAPDPLAAYTWAYCGIWVAMLVVNSISVLAQIITYFFWPIFAMLVVAGLVRSRHGQISGNAEVRS